MSRQLVTPLLRRLAASPPPLTSQRYSFDRPLPASQLIVYCRSGKRSATAAEELEKRGYRNVRNYQGSWLDWEARRKEKAQGESKWDDDD